MKKLFLTLTLSIFIFSYGQEKTLVFENYLDFRGPSQTSVVLTEGQYILEVSGTYCVGSCWDGHTLDAAYQFQHPYDSNIQESTRWTWNEYCPQDDNSCNTPRPDVDEYNSDHIYEYSFYSEGSTETFYGVSDECCWGDNQGGLTFKVYSVETSQDILLNGTVSAESNQIKNVADPTDAQDAATKGFIEGLLSDYQSQIDDLQDQIDALQASSGSETVTDQDGNSYPYLTYGNQVWTVKNAEVVTYRDGTPIPRVSSYTEWRDLETGAWCYYDNDPSKGKLYNWFAVNGIHDAASLSDASQRKAFAPEGWHVPADDEWTTLENYLVANGYNYDGTPTGNKIAKAMASTTGWNISTSDGAPGNDQSLNNSSGFNAFPVGIIYSTGDFEGEGTSTSFWSYGLAISEHWRRSLSTYNDGVHRDSYGSAISPKNGFSVRFVRD